MSESIMTWHEDGHSFFVTIDKSFVIPTMFHCPNRADETAVCMHGGDCVVERFVDVYGFDCNVGVVEVSGPVEIAWTVVGDVSDPDNCQIWIIPIKDEFFSAWATGQKTVTDTGVEGISE
jgi:hypothetical protein